MSREVLTCALQSADSVRAHFCWARSLQQCAMSWYFLCLCIAFLSSDSEILTYTYWNGVTSLSSALGYGSPMDIRKAYQARHERTPAKCRCTCPPCHILICILPLKGAFTSGIMGEKPLTTHQRWPSLTLYLKPSARTSLRPQVASWN